MGIAAIGGRLLSGLTGLAQRAAPALRAAAPSILGGLGFGAAFAGAESFFGDNGSVGTSAVGAIAPPGATQRFVQLQDGSRVLVSRQGKPMKAQLFLPAGAKLPGGATVVSVSPDGMLFGIRRGRKRRPAFKTEIDTCKTTIAAAKSLVKATKN